MRTQLSGRRGPIKTRFAVGASVLAHGLVLLLLSRLDEGRRPPRAHTGPGLERTISLELRSAELHAPSAQAAPHVQPSSQPPRGPTALVPRALDERRSSSLLRMRELPALPSPQQLARAIVGGDAAPVASGEARDETDTVPMAEQLDRYFREGQARNNVAAGRVHPQLHEVLRLARARWAEQRALVAAAGETLGDDLRPFFRGYIDRINRQREAEANQLAPTAARKGAPPMLGHHNRLRAAARALGDRLTCIVCLVLGANSPPEVSVADSSGSLTFDRAALASMSAVAPRELSPDAHPGRACYRFTGLYYRPGVAPSLFCELDDVDWRLCALPGKPMVELEVALESVE